jgi:endonuclease YncB( thermonuclease family)
MLTEWIAIVFSGAGAAAWRAGTSLARVAARPSALRAALVAIGLLVSLSAQAGTYPARVVAITDGNTLRAVHEGREITVRLRWIDSPEIGQRYSSQAKQALGEMVAGQVVTVRDFGSDAHGRRLADVVLPDGRNVNRELVRLGWAWWFRKYSRDVTLGTLEADARAAKRGLWADAHPVPPWEWRASQSEHVPRVVTPAKLPAP